MIRSWNARLQAHAPSAPRYWDMSRSWLIASTQSIGGGPSVLLLIRRVLVERHCWLSQREFLEDYAISKMSLGINLIALAGLIGRRIDRTRAIAGIAFGRT